MNNNIVFGRDLSIYKTVGISLGQAKKENNDGIKAKFAVFHVKDTYSFFSKTKKLIMFEGDDIPSEIFNRLKKYADTTKPDVHGGYTVNTAAFRASEDFEACGGENLFVWEGMMVMSAKLRGGAHYANDVDGKRMLDKATKSPIIRDTVSILVQVKYIQYDAEGNEHPQYVDGLGYEQQLNRIQSRFFREPVQPVASPTPAKSAIAADVKADAVDDTDDAPF